jgi:hypothetical protein
MVYATRDNWVYGLWPSSNIVKNNIEHNASETEPVSLFRLEIFLTGPVV